MKVADPNQYTKYEKARMIGSRALQIAMGAPVLVKLDKKFLEGINFNPIEIAKKEFSKELLPICGSPDTAVDSPLRIRLKMSQLENYYKSSGIPTKILMSDPGYFFF